jgi:hypothetical protein
LPISASPRSFDFSPLPGQGRKSRISSANMFGSFGR